MKKICCVLVLLTGCLLSALEFQCSFAKGKWNQNDFIMAKSPRWDNFNQWTQEEDHIVQDVPADVTDEALRTSMQAENYVSMCFKEKVPFTEKLVFSSEMSFDEQMAPLLVIAPEIGLSKHGIPEFREHWEIVLFDKGLNIWHHFWKDGKPSWTLAAYARKPFLPKTKYRLEVTVTKVRGGMIEVKCGDLVFGCLAEGIADSLFLGITACEGRNRFYDFQISAK